VPPWVYHSRLITNLLAFIVKISEYELSQI
jgi:hypothetical protein